MPTQRIREKDKAKALDLVTHASRQAVIDAYVRITERYGKNQRWLNARHRYGDVIGALANEKQTEIDVRALAEYVAASMTLHLVDGWSFLSRAFDAIVRGDRATSIHLAYYAELRATMSLLASQGIGVFGQKHVAVTTGGSPRVWERGTHVAAWRLLDAWSSASGSAEHLLSALHVRGRSIADRVDEARVVVGGMSASTSVRQSIPQAWLEEWSIDLRDFETDRELRNQVSYRPWGIAWQQPDDLRVNNEVLCSISECWRSLEPDGFTGARIDHALLARALRMAHVPSSREEEGESIGGFLFDAAAGPDRGLNRATPILARATLMLRLGTAANSQMLKDTGVDMTNFDFWWREIVRRFGLWEATGSNQADQPEQTVDLWADVAEALDDIEATIEDFSGATIRDALGAVGPRVAATQFVRAPLWLLPLQP